MQLFSGPHVLVDVVQAAVVGHEARNLLAVLDELHAHALADGGVRLLGLNAAARRGTERRGRQWVSTVRLRHQPFAPRRVARSRVAESADPAAATRARQARERTSSPARCPSRASSQRTASSTRSRGSRGRSPCRSTAARGAACAACDRLPDRESSCEAACVGAVIAPPHGVAARRQQALRMTRRPQAKRVPGAGQRAEQLGEQRTPWCSVNEPPKRARPGERGERKLCS